MVANHQGGRHQGGITCGSKSASALSVSFRDTRYPHPRSSGSCSKSPGDAGVFYGPVFRRAWTTPVARRSDGASGRFRIDRLVRSIGDLQDIVRAVRARGASLKAIEQPIDTSTAAGKCFLDMLGVFAEFETNLRRERQLKGIAKAKAAGMYKGRPTSIDAVQVRAMKAQAHRPSLKCPEPFSVQRHREALTPARSL
jgi:hypothetical protein